jgi:hypothetical protein
VLGPYIAMHSYHGAASWTVVVTGEAVGALAGGLVGIRFQPNRSMLVIGAFFAVTAAQSALLAVRASLPLLAVAAAGAGFAFSFGSLVWETCSSSESRATSSRASAPTTGSARWRFSLRATRSPVPSRR